MVEVIPITTIALRVFGLLYELIMITMGILSLRAAKRLKDRKITLFGAGLLMIGCGDLTHTIGHIVARDLWPEAPWSTIVDNATSMISISLATGFYTCIYLYTSLVKKGIIDRLGKVLICLAPFSFIISSMSIPFANSTIMRVPHGRIFLYMAVLVLAPIGYISCYSLLTLAERLKRSREPVIAKRYTYVSYGVILMTTAITLVLIHPLPHLIAPVVGLIGVRIITVIKTSSLLIGAFLTYLGIVGPRWFLERLMKG